MLNVNIHKLMVLASSLFLGACGLDSNSNANSVVQMATPSVILQARAVDPTQVRPIVTLSNGQSVRMSRLEDGSGSWTGTISVPTNQSYVVTVLWVETIQSRELQLLRLDQTITVTPDNSEFSLDASRYTKNLDDDGDGATNLDERIANTDPFFNDGEQIAGEPSSPDDPTPVSYTHLTLPTIYSV